MGFEEVWNNFWHMLYSDITPELDFPETKPILAHYTSLANLESILTKDEVWLSNPLDMNDFEEVRFGVNAGMDIIYRSERLRDALGTDQRLQAFFGSVQGAYDRYGNDHAIDLHVMCFSNHDIAKHTDGRLSMWRGYGQNGRGACLVIDSSRVPVLDDSPLAVAPVWYGSQQERREKIEARVDAVSDFIEKNVIPDEYVHAVGDALFVRLWLFAIYSKHAGFAEEDEWRLVYLKDRDKDGLVTPFLGYFNGPDGIKPKLKLPARPIPGLIKDGFEFSDIIQSIIIGPTASSPLAKKSVERMLEAIGKPGLKDKIHMSEIPFRG